MQKVQEASMERARIRLRKPRITKCKKEQGKICGDTISEKELNDTNQTDDDEG
jgi:hypothetical protein